MNAKELKEKLWAARVEMEEAEGVFTIDRRCAREALGFIVPEGMENEEIAVASFDILLSFNVFTAISCNSLNSIITSTKKDGTNSAVLITK